MDCPKCSTQVLVPEKSPKGVEIDRCPTCRGIWLDKDKVFAFTPKKEALSKILQEGFQLTVPTSRACPRCAKLMKQARLEPKKLLLETCLGCGGIWMDDDELQILLSMAES